MIENIMEHLAFEANLDPVDVRLTNLAAGNKMSTLLPRFIKSTDYRRRMQDVKSFNAENRWRKRGLGIALMDYEVFHLMPFGATVSIYHLDGSVILSHSGIEVGQGILQNFEAQLRTL